MPARAHPEATVRSASLHTIAAGAAPLLPSEYIVYAPTLLPDPRGNASTAPAIDLPNSGCPLSRTSPVFLSTAPRKLIGSDESSTVPAALPRTITLTLTPPHP